MTTTERDESTVTVTFDLSGPHAEEFRQAIDEHS